MRTWTRLGVFLALLGAPVFAVKGQQLRIDERYYQQAAGALPLDPSYLPVLAGALVQESRRLTDEASYEYAGTYQGQQVITRSYAVGQAADQVQQTLGRYGAQSQPFQRALAGLDAAVGGVQNAIRAAGNRGQATARTMRRIDRLLSDLRRLTNAPGGGYYPPPIATGIDRARFSQVASGAESDVNQAASILYDGGWAQAYPYDQAVQELDNIAYGLQGLQSLIDAQVSDNQLRDGVREPRSRVRQVDVLVRAAQSTAPPPRNFTAYWERAKQGIETLNSMASGGGGVVPPPIQPPVLPPILPPVQPPPIYPPAGGGPIDTIDRMANELNAFVGQIQATINVVPEGFQFQRDGRALQSSLSQLRQQLLGGGGPAPQKSLRQVELDYRRLLDRVERVSQGRPGPNNDRVRRMAPMLDRLRAQILG